MTRAHFVTAAAGRRGDDVRSDCWIQLSPSDRADIAITLRSKVAALYGEQIRAQVTGLLAQSAVRGVQVELDDAGALPVVIEARLQAAAERAGLPLPDEPVPDRAGRRFAASTRDRRRRSRLYLPGNEPKFMLNAALHGPDAVILDLEDSVAPREKDAARWLVRGALASVDFGDCERMVRINQGALGLTDLDRIAGWGVQVFLIPKVESPAQVRTVAGHIATLRAAGRAGFAAGEERAVHLMPIIESARGAWHAYEIASADPTVVALAIGLEDYTADLGAQRTRAGRESAWARAQVVNGARAAGVQPIDSVFSDVEDLAALEENAAASRRLGFEGMGCIHPRQIRVIHAAFAPSAAELARAREIVAAFEAAEAQGLGVVALGSKMIDPPVVKRALRLVQAAEARAASAAERTA
jgi:citrate lyase subunit beta / citryl-CoA lyase